MAKTKYHVYEQSVNTPDAYTINECVFISEMDTQHGNIPFFVEKRKKDGAERFMQKLGSFEKFDNAYKLLSKYLLAGRSDKRSRVEPTIMRIPWFDVVFAARIGGLAKADAKLLSTKYAYELKVSACRGSFVQQVLEFDHGILASNDDIDLAMKRLGITL